MPLVYQRGPTPATTSSVVGARDDKINGGAGDDALSGGGGDDNLNGGGGSKDTCVGNGGDDSAGASCEVAKP